jgi:bifunctional ADP-heptose synthase (sugar kinase/adenylyltransferase)
MVGDCQSSSQVGDLLKYKKMNLITPTEREARICTKNNDDGLVILAEDLRKKTNAENIILKLGNEGLIIHYEKNKVLYTDKIEALNNSPIDPAGAGDSLMISSAMALKSGASIWEAAYIGSLSSGIQVGRLGNVPLKKKDIINS